jgi:hypothetical protein
MRGEHIMSDTIEQNEILKQAEYDARRIDQAINRYRKTIEKAHQERIIAINNITTDYTSTLYFALDNLDHVCQKCKIQIEDVILPIECIPWELSTGRRDSIPPNYDLIGAFGYMKEDTTP